MRKLLIITVATSLVSLTSIDTKAQSLIQNGSFELPGFTGNAVPGQQEKVVAPSTDITGWVVGGTGDVYVHEYPVGPASSFGPAENGSYYLDLSGDGAPHATVYQDFSTTPGNQYSLSFYIGASDQAAPTSIINVQLSGTSTLLDTTLTPLAPDADGIDWLKETFTFTPDSATTRLSFVDTSGIDDNTSFVDNVSVETVPEPSTTMLLLSSALGSLLFFRRKILRLV